MVSKNWFCCISLRTAVTTIAITSTTFYFGILIWLLKERNVVYNFPEQSLSAAIAAFWSLITIIVMYLVSSVFGVVGGIAQNKNMIDVFRFLYWTMAMILLLSSSLLWIVLTFKQDTILDECQAYVTSLSSPQNMSSTASSYTTSSSSTPTIISPHSFLHEECVTATKQFLTVTGAFVLLGNVLQLYFATTINAYARRLKLKSTAHYKRIHLAEDYPDATSKISIY